MNAMINHHVSDELLLDYATGTLGEGWSIAVATHLALSPEGRARLALLENAGGQLLEDIDFDAPAEVDQNDSWQRMKAKLSTESARAHRISAPAVTRAVSSATIPEPLRSYLGGDLDQLKWRALGRGAYQIRIPTADGESEVRLLRIPAGKPVPEHSHGGRELTVVLKGAFSDGEQVFRRGDIEEADESLTHQPIATPDEDCICLAVTDAPLKFKSFIVRLVQPALGI